jgi:4-hydroxy-tetrahydrodipicolinate reductase
MTTPAATTKLIMHGAAGRMGQKILTLAAADPAIRIIAGVDRQAGSLRALGVPTDAPLVDRLPVEPGAVVIDFSHHSAFPAVAAHCAAHGMALVSGTTGIAPAELAKALDAAAAKVPVLHAMNMSVGVNVVFQMAAKLAAVLGEDYDIEVVEAHHHHKKDAPSGTAYGITDAICAATGRTRSDLVHGREGDVGARRKGEIGVHALRMGDVVGDHTVYYVGNGERIMLGHVAHSRDIFAQGALRAAVFMARQAPGRYAMAQVLGL